MSRYFPRRGCYWKVNRRSDAGKNNVTWNLVQQIYDELRCVSGEDSIRQVKKHQLRPDRMYQDASCMCLDLESMKQVDVLEWKRLSGTGSLSDSHLSVDRRVER